MERKIELSQKQLVRLHVIQNYNSGIVSRKSAAEQLDLSERQITRLAEGVKKEGASFLIHKNSGRKPAHAISKETEEAILTLFGKEEHKGVNFLHFKDIIAEELKIYISYSALTSILKKAGNQSPKKKKIRKKHHRRPRKEHPGELLQIDASPFDWLRINEMLNLHGSIDDATGEITGLYMCENECLYGYWEMMRMSILDYGIPQSVYSDKHTIFRSPKTDKLSTQELVSGKTVNLTQFGRGLDELGINIIYANSPQAKGRIERLWETLQSRLPVEFARRGIRTIKAANEFLKEYVGIHNDKFAVKPKGKSIFVPLREDINIDHYLCIKNPRKTDSAGVFSFKGRTFQVVSDGYPLIPSRANINVLTGPRIGMLTEYNKQIFENVSFIKKDSIYKGKKKQKRREKIKKGILESYPYQSPQWHKVFFLENLQDNIDFLYEVFFKKQA